jgi:ferritin-like metal-binding protein YciE
MSITTTRQWLLRELADVYDAEQQLVKAYQEMHGKASDQNLRTMIERHVDETEKQQIKNLDRIFQGLGESRQSVSCKGAKGLISEGQSELSETDQETVSDLTILATAAKAEHYEIASYRTLIGVADFMGEEEARDLLQENLRQEERMADQLEKYAPEIVRQAPVLGERVEVVEVEKAEVVQPVVVREIDQNVVSE